MDDWPTVELTASGVVPFPIDLCWAITRDFGAIGKVWDGMGMAGQKRRVRSRMLEDVPGTCVGGYRRLEVGDMILVQQLDAVDDEEHKLKYHAVDHPMNRWDPPGSFVNDGWTISMKPVSMGQMTHIHMTGKFLTEPENKSTMSSFIMEMCNGVVTGVDSYLTRAEAAGMLYPRGPPLGWGQPPGPAPSSHHQQQHYQPQHMRNAAQHMASAPTGMNRAPMGMDSPLMDGFAARASHTMYCAQQTPNGQNTGYSAPGNANLPNASTSYPMPHIQGVPSNMGYSAGYPARANQHYQPAQTSHPMHHASQQVPRGVAHHHAASGNAGQSAVGNGPRMHSPSQQVPQGMGAHASMAAPRSPSQQVPQGMGAHASAAALRASSQQVPQGMGAHASMAASSATSQQVSQGMGAHSSTAAPRSPSQQVPQGMGAHPSTVTPRSPVANSKSQPQQASPFSSAFEQGLNESQCSPIQMHSMQADAASRQASDRNAGQQGISPTGDDRQLTTRASFGSDASSGCNPRQPCSSWPSGMSASGVSAAQLGTNQPLSHTSSPANSCSGSQPSPMHQPQRASHFLQQLSLQPQQPNRTKSAGLDQAGLSAHAASNAEQTSQPQPHMSQAGHHMNQPGQQMSHAGQQVSRLDQQSAAMLSSTWDCTQQQPESDPQHMSLPSQSRHQAQQMGYPSHRMQASNWGNGPSRSPDFLPPHQAGFDGLQMPGLAQAMGQMTLNQGVGSGRAPSAR